MKSPYRRVTGLTLIAAACVVGLVYAGAVPVRTDAVTETGTTHDIDGDYASWAVDPTVPGQDLPPTGRSLFDHLVTERIGDKGIRRIPFPFSALIEHIESGLEQSGFFGGTRVAMIPMGRSLQRAAATPDFFKYPRIVFAVTGEPIVHERDSGALLKDRLYIGYVEKTGTLEVISYNEAAGRFEFQLVKDYRPGAQPEVFYANRAICITCHQNHAPIFSSATWGETNANAKMAAMLRAQRGDFDRSAQANIDFPDDIDKSTVRANTLVTLQSVWQQGCSDARDQAQSRRCRAAAFTSMLQYGLSGEQVSAFGSQGYQSDFVATFTRIWQQKWPQGLRMAQSSLPDRNPFGGTGSYYGGGNTNDDYLDLITASHVPAPLDPLNPRPAREIWRFAGAMDAHRFISGWAGFFAEGDFRALDANLMQQAARGSVQRTVYPAPCTAIPGTTGFRMECASDTAAPHAVRLAGRFDDRGNARIDWISFGAAGQLRDLLLDGKVAHPAGTHYTLRAIPKKNGSSARLPNGNALASVQIRWPAASGADRSKPVMAHIEIVVLNDFARVRQAIDRLLARQPSIFDFGPLVRATLMRALFSELGMPERSWCCIDDADMPPARLDLAEINTETFERPEWQPFFRYCAACHLTREEFPPNFLAGDTRQVAENLRQCAPRIWLRLSEWHMPAGQRVKSPMPPATALPGMGTTTHQWTASKELEGLRAYVETLARQNGQPSTVAELVKYGYESLPPCLPVANQIH